MPSSTSTSARGPPALLEQLGGSSPRAKIRTLITDIRGKAAGVRRAVDKLKNQREVVGSEDYGGGSRKIKKETPTFRLSEDVPQVGRRVGTTASQSQQTTTQVQPHPPDAPLKCSTKSKMEDLAELVKNAKLTTTELEWFLAELEKSFHSEIVERVETKLAAVEIRIVEAEDAFFRAKHALVERELRKALT